MKFNSSSIIWNYMKVLNRMNYYINESLIYYINLLLQSDIKFSSSSFTILSVISDCPQVEF